MHHRCVLLVATAALVLTGLAGPASAAWVRASPADGAVQADALGPAPVPVVTGAGATVAVAWTAATSLTGLPVGGYRITRVTAEGGPVLPAAGGCQGIVTALSCEDAPVPSGHWRYRLEAVRGAWVGPAGAASAVVAVDATGPTIGAGVLQKASGGAVGAVRLGDEYRLYADAVDLGATATGVTAVVADASALTPGATTVAMEPGPFAVGGVTYTHRSGVLAATTPQGDGTVPFALTASDAAGNVTDAVPFAAAVDDTPPAALDVQITDGGGNPGRAEPGDVVSLLATEALDPASVLAGWDGSATAVTVRLVNNGGGDRLVVSEAEDGSPVALGTVFLGDRDYVRGMQGFTASTMYQAGAAVVIVLGAPDGGGSGTVTTPGTATWSPTPGPLDAAGNPLSTTPAAETGPPDVEF